MSQKREKPGSLERLDDDASRKAMSVSVNAFSRVLAVMVLMILPAAVGYYLDRWLDTSFWIVVGLMFGMVFAVFGMIFVAKQANRELKEDR